jgi:hypothetical protein
MSITAFKRKSVINYGSKRSGKGPGGYWIPQGPFGNSAYALNEVYGASGFSINGSHRNIGGVGRDMKMSKSGTPYRGMYPIGFGGTYGTYPSATLVGNTEDDTTGVIPNAHSTQPAVNPVLNARIINTLGDQYEYVKPSVLSTYGMLEKKYKWIRNGQYPNYWVQPNYTGNQTDSGSQQVYIQNKAAKNACNLKINKTEMYEGYIVKQGPTLCTPGRSTARFKYNDMARNGPYTKTLYNPVSYAAYNLHLTRGCNNPVREQKPFPFAVQTGTGHSAAGSSIRSFGSSCNTSRVYLTPPEWYTQ